MDGATPLFHDAGGGARLGGQARETFERLQLELCACPEPCRVEPCLQVVLAAKTRPLILRPGDGVVEAPGRVHAGQGVRLRLDGEALVHESRRAGTLPGGAFTGGLPQSSSSSEDISSRDSRRWTMARKAQSDRSDAAWISAFNASTLTSSSRSTMDALCRTLAKARPRVSVMVRVLLQTTRIGVNRMATAPSPLWRFRSNRYRRIGSPGWTSTSSRSLACTQTVSPSPAPRPPRGLRRLGWASRAGMPVDVAATARCPTSPVGKNVGTPRTDARDPTGKSTF